MIFKEGCLRSHLIRITHENWPRRKPWAHGRSDGARVSIPETRRRRISQHDSAIMTAYLQMKFQGLNGILAGWVSRSGLQRSILNESYCYGIRWTDRL